MTKTSPILSNFNTAVERTIESSSVVLQDELVISLGSGIQDKYRMPKDKLDSSGPFVTKVDKYSPIRSQVLSELLGDNTTTRDKMLANNSVGV